MFANPTLGRSVAQPTSSDSGFRKILWTLSALPTVALVLLGSLAVRVRLQGGAWPVANQPDPKDLGLHYSLTLLAILASFVVVVVVPAIALAGYTSGQRRVALPVAAAIATFAVFIGDLGGVGTWFGD